MNSTALEQRQDFALDQYAKGLLKPFLKGKGGIIRFRDELEEECRRLWQEAADFANQYNRTVVQAGLWLKPHNNSGGRVRAVQWRDKGQTQMGRRLLEAVLQYGDVPQSLKRELVEIETKRTIFNAKIAAVTRQVDRLNKVINDLDEIETMENSHPTTTG
ncbi:DUF3158 family protein [Salinicola sp. LHM]|uniref:DUF3158 family protein n=1 Tax=Halomonadaceae TaxID=28256 RepID=UPI0015F2C2D3|nr:MULTISPECIES: DUF3158 family protein [Halomonadaceae]MDF9434671.1 DUF3158 family protein [Chromohalobacter israelensis]WQH33443.1 DUF3158 family protein [Salinicola sp. LHM]